MIINMEGLSYEEKFRCLIWSLG